MEEVRGRGPVESRCLFCLLDMAVELPSGPAGFRMQGTSASFLAPFARAQEIGRDPREDPLLGAGQMLSS